MSHHCSNSRWAVALIILINIIVSGQHVTDHTKDHDPINDSYGEDLVVENQCKMVPIVHLLQYPGCLPQTIASFACRGYCNSYVQPSRSKFWQLERSCTCCQQIGEREALIKLECPGSDRPIKEVITKAPVNCLCRACIDIDREDIKPQELVEALAKDNNK